MSGMLGIPSGVSQGSTNTWKVGSKKKRFAPVILATLTPNVTGVGGEQTFEVTVKGLNTDLVALVSAGILRTPDSIGLSHPYFLPSEYPPNPGTIQLIPIHGVIQNGGQLAVREVFQDPTSTDNADDPLPQNIPFGWSYEPQGVDDVLVRVVIPTTSYADGGWNQNFGQLAVLLTVEYVGEALGVTEADVKAIEFAMGQVSISTVEPVTIQTT